MQHPKISVIIPVYNVSRYLPRCLDSILSQTMRELEIICINDGSTDDSLSILEMYAHEDDRIIVLNQKNSGVSVTRNTGLDHVSGDYYMFVDSDDWLEPDTCEVAYSSILSYQADCLMFSYIKEFGKHSIKNHLFESNFVWDKEDVLSKFHRRLFGPIGEELSRPQDGDIIVSPCMQLFKADKFSSLRFYDIREIGSFEDGLYQMDLYLNCNRLIYLDRPFYHYRKTNDSSITTRYNPDLISQWQHLFDIVENKIPKNTSLAYHDALNNRICLSVLGLGLNSIKSPKSILGKSNELKELLKSSRYRAAYKHLSLDYFPFHWQVFFLMAKYRLSLSLVVMLTIIDYLRKHRK